MKLWQSSILFLVLLIGASAVYNYHNTCFERPQSVHKWRQTDCASIALNYYQDGMDFTHPETHNLTSDGGTTGANAASEVPILYYSAAALYKVFGYNEAIYRIFNALLFFLGLFYLFRAIRYLLKDEFWSIAITLLFFASPLLVYYGNSFLSNSTALSFSFIGWYFFVRFYLERKSAQYNRALLFFGLAACFKITALFSLLAIVAVGILELLGLESDNRKERIFTSPLKQLLPVVAILGVVGGWILYANGYNQAHGSTYFSTTIFPIWDLSGGEIKEVISEVVTKQFPVYFHLSALVFLAISFLYLLIRFKQFNKLLRWVILLITGEIVLYAALQFWTFADHDYYTINMFILPVLLLIACFENLKRNAPKLFSSAFLKGAMVLLVGFNIYHAKAVVDQRYEVTAGSRALDQHWMELTPKLAELGITPLDTVIALPDDSHASLYWMNVKGWTDYIDTQFNQGEKKYYNKDRQGIEASISNGARFLILNGKEELFKRDYLTPFCTHLLWTNDQISIFDLRNPEQNFEIAPRDMSQYITCGAERVEGLEFVSDQGDRLQGGQFQSSSPVFEGEFSCRLGPDAPFAMTYAFDQVNSDESFEISAWRFGANGQTGQLVASCANQGFYNNHVEVIERQDDGWEKVSLKFLIPKGWNNEELKFYMHDSSGNEVFFDNLEMTRSTIVD